MSAICVSFSAFCSDASLYEFTTWKASFRPHEKYRFGSITFRKVGKLKFWMILKIFSLCIFAFIKFFIVLFRWCKRRLYPFCGVKSTPDIKIIDTCINSLKADRCLFFPCFSYEENINLDLALSMQFSFRENMESSVFVSLTLS